MARSRNQFNPEPRSVRLRRRLVTVPRNLTILFILTLLFPLLALGCLVVDSGRWVLTRRPFVAIRLLVVGWVFFASEAVGLLRFLATWITTGFGADWDRLVERAWPVQAWWGRTVFGTIRRLFGLELVVEGEELIAPGPLLAMFRHASIVDNLLPLVFVTDRNGVRLRWVIKKELLTVPALDVGGNRLPNYFVDREAKDSRREIKRIRSLSENLGPHDGVLIYPEGTRFTEAKRRRALARLAESSEGLHERAKALHNVLPPRVGGPMILLDSGADVVFCAHEGLGGFATIGDIWSGRLVGRTIRIKFWRVPASDIPKERSARIDWLFDQWRTLDEWITAATDVGLGGEALPA